jgi:hypothetical protein
MYQTVLQSKTELHWILLVFYIRYNVYNYLENTKFISFTFINLSRIFLGFTTALCSESDGGGVNLKCIDAHAVMEWENDTKFHVFVTKHKANT